MRIVMVSGSPGKAEGGVAGIVHNLAKELGQLGHSVEPKFFEDLLPAQKWPSRFCAIEFSRRIAGYVQEKRASLTLSIFTHPLASGMAPSACCAEMTQDLPM